MSYIHRSRVRQAVCKLICALSWIHRSRVRQIVYKLSEPSRRSKVWSSRLLTIFSSLEAQPSLWRHPYPQVAQQKSLGCEGTKWPANSQFLSNCSFLWRHNSFWLLMREAIPWSLARCIRDVDWGQSVNGNCTYCIEPHIHILWFSWETLFYISWRVQTSLG